MFKVVYGKRRRGYWMKLLIAELIFGICQYNCHIKLLYFVTQFIFILTNPKFNGSYPVALDDLLIYNERNSFFYYRSTGMGDCFIPERLLFAVYIKLPL